ncbi:MAG: hypothetical protein KDC46_11000 [Thermoleophilia bacterium]|nr:hypothetical protein [Thermoleophilia bacterium]
MQVDRTQTMLLAGAGAGMGVGFTALRHGASPKALALGLATGVVASAANSYTQSSTGVPEFGLAASILGGAASGALLLGGAGMPHPGATPLASRGLGAVIGAAAGLLGPIAAGIVLAQIRPHD